MVMRERTAQSETRNERRARAREAARRRRAEARRRAQRRKVLGWSGSLLALAAAIVAVVLLVTQPHVAPAPGPRNMASGGVRFVAAEGAAAPVLTPASTTNALADPSVRPESALGIVIYEDLLCPACRVFEEANLSYLQQLVADGTAELEIHPIAILDHLSLGSRYSTRAAAALACVADRAPDSFLAANVAMFARQPSEGTRGLTNGQIVDVLHDAGVDSDGVSRCISRGTYRDWVGAVSTIRTNTPAPGEERITGTPTVLVDGARFEGSLTDSAAFQRFVEAAREQRAAGR